MFLISPNGMSGTGGGKTGQGVTAFEAPVIYQNRKKSVSGPASTHHPAAVPPAPAVVNLNPNVTDYQPFRKGSALQPDVQRMDAGTGESYNPSNPMDRLTQTQVKQAYNAMSRKYGGIPALSPIIDIAPIQPIQAPLVSTGGGGGGGGGGGVDQPEPEAPVGFWANLSTMAKVGIIGGGALAAGFVIYKLARGGSVVSSHKRYRS